jgi:hypothetical protein
MRPTPVECTNKQPNRETLAADVLQSVKIKINVMVGGCRLDAEENGNIMTIHLNLHTLKRAGHPT